MFSEKIECVKNINLKTPTPVNYRILETLEQIMTVVSKGTDLGLTDLISALYSGYFIETGGAITPAVEGFLSQKIQEEKERERRTKRAWKAVAYGSYNLSELIQKVNEVVHQEGQWQAVEVETYKVVAVDITAFYRSAVQGLVSKAYKSEAQRAVQAVPVGLVAQVGVAGGQRVALLKSMVSTNLKVNEPTTLKKQLYQEVARQLAPDEIALFDAGFGLLEAVSMGITRCLIRLAKNDVFGRTEGKIPQREKGQLGRPPSKYQAEVVRPLVRQHGQKLIPATPPDKIEVMTNAEGQPLKLEIWKPVYFLERQLEHLSEPEKKRLRGVPLQVVAVYHPDYEEPLLLGTPLLSLTPAGMPELYPSRWPVEGLPQTAKYILSGGGGTHYVHHPLALQRFPQLVLLFGSLLKYIAATTPPIRTGFWDRVARPTYGRLLRYLKKVAIPLSEQLFKKQSVTAHLPVGYEAIRLAKCHLASKNQFQPLFATPI